MRILLIVLALLTASCSSTSSFNPTVFPFQYKTEAVETNAVKKVIVATVNLGTPTRMHLRKPEKRVKAMVKGYLRDNGYEVLPNYHFDNAWKQAERSFGKIYDPTTGKLDVNTWRQVLATTGQRLRESTDADAIIFADVIEHDVQHSASMKHFARWYGVTRKPALQGTGQGVPMDFNWSQNVKAASLMVTVFDMNLSPIFSSRGGIDTLQAVDLKRSTPSFIRRKKLLKSADHIEEGIQLSFHPFIVMKNYPGKEE